MRAGETWAAGVEDAVLTLRGRDWHVRPLAERQALLESCFRYWRVRGFPYYRLTDAEIESEVRRLRAVPASRIVVEREVRMSMVGVRLANAFHPQMWHVPVGSARTPVERFHDDDALRKMLKKALGIWPNRFSVNASNLRRMLKTYSDTAGVSNFRPTAAKALCERFSSAGEPVLDFSAGYGGRLLGASAAGRPYTGIEPCTDQLAGLRDMVAALRRCGDGWGAVTLYQACAEDILPGMAGASFPLVLSSPPYYRHERYSTEPTQSYLRYPTYERWLRGFIRPVLAETRRVLERGGVLLLNVADVNGYSVATDVLRIAKEEMVLAGALWLRLGRKPYLRDTGHPAYKFEPILVLRKRRR
jgi:SAM-dependent methyltransferase